VPEDSTSGFDALARRAREALAGAAPADGEPAERRSYAGEAADGLVHAEVDGRGRVLSLRIEPEVFKRPLADVAAAARVAINAALDSRPGRADLAPVIEELQAAGALARQELSAITQGIAQITAEVRAARGTTPREA
jgi:DNA-binding protein YbaB